MILLCGIPSEPPVRLVATAAEECGIDYVLFNQRHAEFNDLCLEVKKGQVLGILKIGFERWNLSDFSGVYSRLMDYHDLPEVKPSRQGSVDASCASRIALLHSNLNDWMEMANCRIMNKSSAMSSNLSKPYQAQFILKAGFHIPDTIVTNDPNTVKNFQKNHKKIIYKSISSERSIVKVLENLKMNEINKVHLLPTQFQEFIPGNNIRVHVVGSDLFATQIVTEAADYRYAKDEGHDTEMTPITLPVGIEKKCINLSVMLDLPLCGIDLKKTPDGKYFCFEVNPSPAYSYYQESTDQQISFSIANYLEGKK